MSDDLIEPSAEEAANGWTAETLTAYVRERGAASRRDATWNLRRKPKPQRCNNRGGGRFSWGPNGRGFSWGPRGR